MPCEGKPLSNEAELDRFLTEASERCQPGPVANLDARELYLDLMKRCLVNWIYPEGERAVVEPIDLESLPTWKRATRGLKPVLEAAGLRKKRKKKPFDPRDRTLGKDWPEFAHSMQGLVRLNNIQHCVETALADGVPGDLLEAGVWRGGGSIFMRAILQAAGDSDRSVWVADSFEGLPKPDAETYPADEGDRHFTWKELAVSLESVQENFRRYGLLDDRVRFLKGWFKDTLPEAPVDRLAVLRVDGDMYESTMDALSATYAKVQPGGFVIIDDYFCLDNCRQAVDDFIKANGLEVSIERIDWTGAFWRLTR